MNYTLICYRPNADDYCMGCHMGSSDSTHEIYYSKDREFIAAMWATCLVEDQFKDQDEAEWEITLLIDGIEPTDIDVTNKFVKDATVLFKERCKIRRENTERENDLIRRNQAEELKKQELNELQRLTTKYS